LGERPVAVPLTQRKSHMTESEAVPISDRLKYGMTTDNGDFMSNCSVHTCSGNRKSCAKEKGRFEGIPVVNES